MKLSMILVITLTLTPLTHASDWGDLLKGAINKPATQSAASVNALSNADMSAGLKEALSRGTDAAVTQLGQKDGFFGNAALRIPLPASLQKADKMMRTLGMSKQADELVLSMNRAAEAAVPEAKVLLVDAVKAMTLEGAKGILTGGKTSATDFFRNKTETKLTERFSPIVKASTEKVGLAKQYNRYASMAAQFNLLDKNQASVEQYVTQQTLDRLYTVIGEKESAIRANPLQAGSELLKKVFGAVAK
jgi:Protein of unknown function (DUF4197)